jgi:ABC-type glutathione transport system ATPase component
MGSLISVPGRERNRAGAAGRRTIEEKVMANLVEIRNVSKVYERGKQKVEVLHHIDLDIAQGDFFALMGPSGSGKTTLLNLIGGLDSPAREMARVERRLHLPVL